MLDPNFIRQNPDKVKQNTRERNMDDTNVDKWLEVDLKRRELIQKRDEVREKRNELSKGIQGKPDPLIIEEAKNLKVQIETLEKELQEVEIKWTELINMIPNIHAADVLVAKSESENKVLRIVGELPKFNFTPKDHAELAKELDLIDFEAGAKVSGSQFYYLKNDAVLLENAVIQYALQFFEKKGYTLIMTPDLAKSKYYLGTGYAPRGDEAQIYEIEGEDLGLIATAEVTMAGYYSDEIFNKNDLPKKFLALSHCFRKESGAYGKYSKGLYRVHQFTKMEMFIYCLPEQSIELHKEILAIEEEITQNFGITYRVIEQCTADLGAMAAKKYDLEAWMPGRNDYGEITSTSNCTDFQSRNMNIKFKNENGDNEYVHMLNGTAIAMSRFPIAIMENYQQEDGSILVPKVLQPYMGKEKITKR